MDLKEKVECDFDAQLNRALANNLYISIEAYQKFVNDKRDYFNLPNKKTVLGHLRTYAVQKQFYDGAFDPNAGYTAQFCQTNNFGSQALQLETEHFILHVGRTEKRGLLPNVAGYKKEMAKLNGGDDSQIQLKLWDYDKSTLKASKNYAILAYGYHKDKGITHFDLLVPNGDFTKIIMPIKSLHIPKFEIVPNFDEVNEPAIASIRKELLIKFNESKG